MGRNVIEVLIQGTDRASGPLQAAGVASGTLNSRLINLAATFSLVKAGVDIVSGSMRKIVSDTVAWASQLENMSVAFGLSVENLSRLEYAGKLSEIGLEDLGVAFRTLINQAQAQVNSTDAASNALSKLGISGTDAAGNIKSLDSLLQEVVAALGRQASASDRAALATDLFGRSGARMLAIFGEGTDALAAMTAEADKYGATLSSGVTKKLDEAGDAWDRVNEASKGYWARLVSEIAVATEPMAQFFTWWFSNLNRMIDGGERNHSAFLEWMAAEQKRQHPATDVFEEEVRKQRLINDQKARDLEAELAREEQILAAAVTATNQHRYALEEKATQERLALHREEIARKAEEMNLATDAMVEQPELVMHTWEVRGLEAAQIIASDFGNAFAQVVTGAQNAADAFKSAFINAIGSIISMLMQMAILKGIGAVFGIPLNTGGEIPKAAHGLEITGGYSGRDTVPALVSRGEVVAPSPTVERLNRFLERAERGRSGGTVNVNPLFFSGSRNEAFMAADWMGRRLDYRSRFIVQGAL